jgi:hypothetical protein
MHGPDLTEALARLEKLEEALAAIAGGVSVLLAVRFATDGRGFGVVSPPLAGLLASALVAGMVLALRRREAAL